MLGLHVMVLPRPTGDYDMPRPVHMQVAGPPGLTGAILAEALRKMGHRSLWPPGNEALDAMNRLPAQGTILLTPFPRPPTDAASASDVSLCAVQGPDCGSVVCLTRGRYSIGRGECDIAIADPALSRHHADVLVDETSITLHEFTAGTGTPGSRRPRTRYLGIGDEFRLGSTTFRLCPAHPASSGIDDAVPHYSWPLPIKTIDGSSGTQRPWMMLLTAFLPLCMGIALALAMGSWIFLAFSALGLFTGGIPAITELVWRRRLRRKIRTASATAMQWLDSAVPPVGSRILATRIPTRHAFADAPSRGPGHPLRLGHGMTLPGVERRPNSDRGPQVRPVPGPVVVDVAPGSSGAILGMGDLLAAVVRSVVLQLTQSCARSGSVLLIVGDAAMLPVETRFLPGIDASPDHEDAAARIPQLPAGSVVMTMAVSDFARLRKLVSTPMPGTGAAPSLPALIGVGIREPVESEWSIEVAAGLLHRGERNERVALDGISRDNLAMACCRLEDGIGSATGMNDRAAKRDTDQANGTSNIGPQTAWTWSSTRTLSCMLGQTVDGPLQLDFVRDGPHILVTGTTGSGKSELIKALTLDLVSRHGPDELALMLLDFKGGSTLGGFSDTPHCQALVTDLNPETAERILEGLRVELLRRESLFKDAGAQDYPAYRDCAPGGPPLPRLLVVVDEFRVLVDELPAAAPELMRIATVGRSLGVHLLLSTQRPQGVVTAAMRANINTVISLRLLNRLDSEELLGSAIAADIPGSAPGRGYMRRAGEPPVAFQSVRIPQGDPVWTITELGPGFSDTTEPLTFRGPAGTGATPVSILEHLTAETTWPELPPRSFAQDLPAHLNAIPRRLRADQPPGAVPLGLLDVVNEQRLAPLWWVPEVHRRLAIVSGPGSGAPTALAGIVGIAARTEPERHLYLLDGSGHLTNSAGLPRVAGYVSRREPDRVAELLDAFEATVAAGCGGTAQRVLVVTGLAVWASLLDPTAYAALDDRLAALARTAEHRDTSLVLLGDRDVLSSRFYALAEHRLFCPFGLGQETVLSWPKLRHTASLPGRAVWVAPDGPSAGTVAQLCTPAADPDTSHAPPARMPLTASRPLPDIVNSNDLPTAPTREGNHLIGIAGPDNRPWSWEPGAVGLILGARGTGKSSLLLLIAQQHVGRSAAFGNAASNALLMQPASGTHQGSAEERTPAAPPTLILADDADLLDAAELSQLEAWAHRGIPLILSATPDRMLYARLPSFARALPAGAFLLLNPRSSSDGDLPAWRFRPHDRLFPGRALGVVDGVLRSIQCALPAA